MKKQLVVIGIITILISVGLCGCNEEESDNNDNTNTIDAQRLTGWYYVLYDSLPYTFDMPLNNTRISENNTYLLNFFENNSKILRLVAYKDTPGAIDIVIGDGENNNLSFSGEHTLEEMVVMDYDESKSYYIWTLNGDVTVNLMQKYVNYKISDYYWYSVLKAYEANYIE